MTISEHQQRIGARIAAHPDLATLPLIVEAAVPNVVEAVTKSLAQARLGIVVASGAGEATTGSALVVTLTERFVVTVAQVAGLSTNVLAPIQIIDRLLPWLHGYRSADGAGATQYQVRRHDPLPEDGPVSGHQITLEIAVGVRAQA